MATLPGAQMRGRNGWYSCLPFFAPGWPRWFFTGGEQGQKRFAAGPLQSLILPRDEFPHLVLLQRIEIDNLVLLPLPFEVTYEMGTRIASVVKASAVTAGAEKAGIYAVISVSNGYCGYLTTPEEYSLQYYEGASNLYGPNTGDFFSAELGRLAADMSKNESRSEFINTSDFKMDIKSFYPDDIVPAGPRSSYRDLEYHKNKNQYDEPYWSFIYYDVPPCLINLHDDLVEIETSADGTNWEPLIINNIKIDDNGYDIAIIFLDRISDSGMGLYEIRWYNPAEQKGRFCRFAVMPRGGREMFYSKAFCGTGIQ
jgi:neutral ceramidase